MAATEKDRIEEIRAAMERVFENGVVPESIIIYSDFGPGKDSVRVSAVGPTVKLVPLAMAGNNQLADLLKQSMQAHLKRKLDS